MKITVRATIIVMLGALLLGLTSGVSAETIEAKLNRIEAKLDLIIQKMNIAREEAEEYDVDLPLAVHIPELAPEPKPGQKFIKIVSCFPDAAGLDRDNEYITLTNTGPEAVDLEGWSLIDSDKNVHTLEEVIEAGQELRIRLRGTKFQLKNDGDKIRLINDKGAEIFTVVYKSSDVSKGERIFFDENGAVRQP